MTTSGTPNSAATLQARLGMYCLVQAETPEQGLVNLGVLLEDPEADLLRLRFRRDLERLVADMDFVPREEFEAVKAMAAKARAENESLAARIAALESKSGN